MRAGQSSPTASTDCYDACCADAGLVLGLKNLPSNVSLDNSQFSNLPGFVIVSNSSVRFTNATFSQGNTNGPGQHSKRHIFNSLTVVNLQSL